MPTGDWQAPATARALAAEFVRNKIYRRELLPGQKIVQEAVSQELGTSRIPVREALRQLEAQALVDSVPHKGAVVTDISASDAADSFAIRRGLEVAALRLSIPRLTDADGAAAAALVDAMEVEADPGHLGQLNRRFHMALYARAGRPRLLGLVDRELAVFDRYLRFFLAARGRERMAQQDHRAMLAAAQAGEVQRAVDVLEGHIDAAEAAMAGFFAQRG